ncbi:hypothetical protein GCM10010841_26320 [Deinococcus aerophilus]|uniref:Uncharacterized protein n=1 Tax=Deinococcus aerophilus TaxID=522488 RepID=A0ABQ2GY22_9DEIO|nr:hypothetical protein GCM10010841_26320 [Deinococcus aerophilus]
MPFVWTALNHDGGRRIQLASRLLKALPTSRRKGLVADRKFTEWFRSPKRKRIKRAMCIRKNAVVDELRVDTCEGWTGALPG